MDTFLIYDCMGLFYSNNEMTVQLSLFYIIYVDSDCLEQNEITLRNILLKVTISLRNRVFTFGFFYLH